MYGLPKVYKEGINHRSMLSIVGSVQHEMAMWLAVLLQPISHLYSSVFQIHPVSLIRDPELYSTDIWYPLTVCLQINLFRIPYRCVRMPFIRVFLRVYS